MRLNKILFLTFICALISCTSPSAKADSSYQKMEISCQDGTMTFYWSGGEMEEYEEGSVYPVRLACQSEKELEGAEISAELLFRFESDYLQLDRLIAGDGLTLRTEELHSDDLTILTLSVRGTMHADGELAVFYLRAVKPFLPEDLEKTGLILSHDGKASSVTLKTAYPGTLSFKVEVPPGIGKTYSFLPELTELGFTDPVVTEVQYKEDPYAVLGELTLSDRKDSILYEIDEKAEARQKASVRFKVSSSGYRDTEGELLISVEPLIADDSLWDQVALIENPYYGLTLAELVSVTAEECCVTVEGNKSIRGNLTLMEPDTVPDAGDCFYTLRFTVTERCNYLDMTLDEERSLTVLPKPVRVQWSDERLMYSGAVQAPSAQAEGIPGEMLVLRTVSDAVSAGGPYTASAELVRVEGGHGRVENYCLVDTETAFRIEPKTVLASGLKALDKVYDGTDKAELDFDEVQLEGAIAGDMLSLSAAGTFRTADAGTDLEVYLTDLTLGGEKTENYILSPDSQRVVHASILPAPLAGGVTLLPVSPEVGDKLTADCTGLIGEAATFRWYRNGARIAESDDPVYTIVPEDSGARIHVEAVGQGNYGGCVSSDEVTVAVLNPVFSAEPEASLVGDSIELKVAADGKGSPILKILVSVRSDSGEETLYTLENGEQETVLPWPEGESNCVVVVTVFSATGEVISSPIELEKSFPEESDGQNAEKPPEPKQDDAGAVITDEPGALPESGEETIVKPAGPDEAQKPEEEPVPGAPAVVPPDEEAASDGNAVADIPLPLEKESGSDQTVPSDQKALPGTHTPDDDPALATDEETKLPYSVSLKIQKGIRFAADGSARPCLILCRDTGETYIIRYDERTILQKGGSEKAYPVSQMKRHPFTIVFPSLSSWPWFMFKG